MVGSGACVAVAFQLVGRRGPLETSAGRVPPTGRRVDLRSIDVLTLTDGRISGIRRVADGLTALAAVDAVHVSRPGGEAVAEARPYPSG
jgi:hypothetical protein